MNKAIIMGRLTRDPDVRYSQGEDQSVVARFTLAVDRPTRSGSSQQKTADFISCVAFGKQAEFAEKWMSKGIKMVVVGHIQTGSYTNKEGQKVYTTDVIVENLEFAESKSSNEQYNNAPAQQQTPAPGQAGVEGFMNIPDGIDEELPFS